MRNGFMGDENNSNAKAASIVTKECQDLALHYITGSDGIAHTAATRWNSDGDADNPLVS